MSKAAITITSIVALLVLAAGISYYSTRPEEEPVDLGEQGISEFTEQKDVRAVVWEQLPSERRELVDGTWSDGKVSTVVFDKGMMIHVEDKSYEGKEVYIIDFPTKYSGVPSNMAVYADMETFDYIGDGMVD